MRTLLHQQTGIALLFWGFNILNEKFTNCSLFLSVIEEPPSFSVDILMCPCFAKFYLIPIIKRSARHKELNII